MGIVKTPVTRRRQDMDLRVLLSTLFLLGVVCPLALKAEDLSEIDTLETDWIEEDGLTRMVEIDHEMESDDYDRIDDEPRDIEDDTDDDDDDDDYGDEDDDDDYGDEDDDDDDAPYVINVPTVPTVPNVPNVPNAGSLCLLVGPCKTNPDERSIINSEALMYEYKNLSAEDCNLKATHFFEKCSNTEDMPITATYTDKNGESSMSKINKKIANPNL